MCDTNPHFDILFNFDPTIKRRFLQGSCGSFAKVLRQRYNYTIVGVIDSEDPYPLPFHYMSMTPNGRLIDIVGIYKNIDNALSLWSCFMEMDLEKPTIPKLVMVDQDTLNNVDYECFIDDITLSSDLIDSLETFINFASL